MNESRHRNTNQCQDGWLKLLSKRNYYDISDLLKPTKLGILFAYILEKALLHTHIHTRGHKRLPNLFYRAWPDAGS